jgi:phytoene synthase
MDIYTKTAYEMSELLTKRYSTSFSTSSRLLSSFIRKHIYAVYGLVRIADEIVDTYSDELSRVRLKDLKDDIYEAIRTGYSTNPIVHAFASTVNAYHIDKKLIKAFFNSMEMDLLPKVFTQKIYEEYIYGSAEVVGLMCLAVFCGTDKALYKKLESGARSLGAAYQKVNFLRDLSSDYNELGRIYFPNHTYSSLDDTSKEEIIEDIRKDFQDAKNALRDLPKSSRVAVGISYDYYENLFKKLQRTSIETIKKKRIRIANSTKLYILIATLIKEAVR